MAQVELARRLAIGAELSSRGVHFRVWAPTRKTVQVVFAGSEGRPVTLEPDGKGYFVGWAEEADAGTLYRYRLDGEQKYPDPASRFQPDGPHGWSQVVDPHSFRWSDNHWPGLRMKGQIIYEMHLGTFTQEGTWASAVEHLSQLAELGITVLEVMPVAEFPGRFGWGYDGVHLFAPSRLYGQPDDFRRFVNEAHALGLGVILDIVYNHFGPDGNYLAQFYPNFFSPSHTTDWGEAINFDGEGCASVREFFLSNVRYWIEEFHLDGFRLDATQDIHDASDDHILRAIVREARLRSAPREVIVIAENEPQDAKLIRSQEQGGYGLDALWNDDFHHSAMVALTGHNEAYYSDYRGNPQEFISTAKYGFLYQGQYYKWQKKHRGTASLDLPPAASINMLQNHDQIANSAFGLRCHALTDPGKYRAMTALLLLAPGTPLLFQGQEFAASSPFLFFADHKSEIADLVRRGRVEFLGQFPSLCTPELLLHLPDPADALTFERSKLADPLRKPANPVWRMHRDLIKLRREDPVFHAQQKGAVDGAVLAADTFLLRFFGGDHGDRLVLINFGRDRDLDPSPEPLLAPPEGAEWTLIWSSENPAYGGGLTPTLESGGVWRIPGHATFAMTSAKPWAN
ncbi:MAG: malto-oligosyltrehalose trehalohydrolase [Bryobacteraceae bacterium]